MIAGLVAWLRGLRGARQTVRSRCAGTLRR